MTYNQYYLCHHGIKGQKWGVRRYQNEDGTLTEEGKRRKRRNIGIAIGVASVAALSVGAFLAYRKHKSSYNRGDREFGRELLRLLREDGTLSKPMPKSKSNAGKEYFNKILAESKRGIKEGFTGVPAKIGDGIREGIWNGFKEPVKSAVKTATAAFAAKEIVDQVKKRKERKANLNPNLNSSYNGTRRSTTYHKPYSGANNHGYNTKRR